MTAFLLVMLLTAWAWVSVDIARAVRVHYGLREFTEAVTTVVLSTIPAAVWVMADVLIGRP